ncbi:MAG: hypothetical protein LBV12_06995 [Puniceicoccales bacterium]|jgi:hypothetical protein|nr:hypothetical protein [Puniceicoccales bacterium]
MKKLVFLITAVTIVLMGVVLVWYGQQRETSPSTPPVPPPSVIKPEENVSPMRLPNKEIPRREDRYFRGEKISETTKWLRNSLYDEKKDSQARAGALNKLGFYGTDEAIRIMTEFLKENEALLPDPPPTKEELGDEAQIKKRMMLEYRATPESKVLSAVNGLISTGSPEASTTVEAFSQRMKAKYAGTIYEQVFLPRLEHEIKRGKADYEAYQKVREEHDL